jgi:hypothetical protein
MIVYTPTEHFYWQYRVYVYIYLYVSALYSKTKFSQITRKRYRNPITGLDRPWGFQVLEAFWFQDNRHMKMVRLSGLCSGPLYPTGNNPGLISVSGWVDLRAVVRPKELCQWKLPKTSSGIEPATFRLVAQYLNQLRHRVRQKLCTDYNFSLNYPTKLETMLSSTSGRNISVSTTANSSSTKWLKKLGSIRDKESIFFYHTSGPTLGLATLNTHRNKVAIKWSWSPTSI